MTAFPALIPSTRTYSPGEYPITPHPLLSGSEIRVRHSNTVLGVRLRLTFQAATSADVVAVRNHYNSRQGGFLPFAIPVELLSGVTTPADFTPAGHQWVYASRPSVVDVPIAGDTPTNRHDLVVELVTVPPENTIVAGARITVRATVRGGSAQLGAYIESFASVVGGAATASDDVFALGAVVTANASVEGGEAEGFTDYGSMKLALLFEGANGSTTFTDSGANAVSITAFNSATITTSTFAQGSASGNFIRASGSYLNFASLGALNFGTGNFRIRFRARLATLPGVSDTYTVIRALDTFNNTVPSIEFRGGSILRLVFPWLGTAIESSALSITANTWYQFEVSRTGTTISFKQDDVSVGSGTFASNVNLGAGGTAIGGNAATSNFDGQLDELLID